MNSRRARVAVPLAAALMVVMSCSFGQSDSGTPAGQDPGPMEFGDGWVEGCAPSAKYRHMAVEQFLTVPSGDASITKVDSKTDGQLEVKGYSLLVDPPGGESIGFVKFPPSSPSWPQATAVTGTIIPSGASAFLIAEIKTTGSSGGKLTGSTIHYEVGGKNFEATTENSFEISPQCGD